MLRKIARIPVGAFLLSLLIMSAVLAGASFAQVPAYITQWTNAQFAGPFGVATDAVGNVYVVDNTCFVYKFDSSGAYLTRFGGPGKTGGLLFLADDVTTDAAGDVYVADSGNGRIEKWTSDGTFVRSFGFESPRPDFPALDGSLLGPRGVAVDAAGYIYVADTGDNRIEKFTSGGAYLTQWGSIGSGSGQFNDPTGVALDAAGSVYVADSGNNRIQKFTGDGVYIMEWPADAPSGVAVDASGTVYATANSYNYVESFASNGAYLGRWGSFGSGNGQFDNPFGVAVDANGNVYIADTGNVRIQKFGFLPTSMKSTSWGRVKSLFR